MRTFSHLSVRITLDKDADVVVQRRTVPNEPNPRIQLTSMESTLPALRFIELASNEQGMGMESVKELALQSPSGA